MRTYTCAHHLTYTSTCMHEPIPAQRFCYDRLMEKVSQSSSGLPSSVAVADFQPLEQVDLAFCRLNRMDTVTSRLSFDRDGDAIVLGRLKDERRRPMDR